MSSTQQASNLKDTREIDMMENQVHRAPRVTRNQRPMYNLNHAAGVTDSDGSMDGAFSDTQPKDKIMTRAPRKKQAVTKTRDRAVIARIELSRKTSPLLKLPTEVLQKILKCILGGRLIHVEYLEPSPDSDLDWFYSDDAMSSTHDADAGLPLGRGADTNVSDVQEILLQTTAKVGFRSTFCESQQSEREAYDEVKTGYESFPPDQDPEFYVAGWKQRHADCYRWRRPGGFELQAGHLERKVDLNVMGTCRQLYEECNVLLWGTNTFSFDDPFCFTRFLQSLNAMQKRKFANVSINFNATMDGFHGREKSYLVQQGWLKAFSPSHIKMLRGLTTLHLCVDLFCNSYYNSISPGYAGPVPHEDSTEIVSDDLQAVKRLQELHLKEVTVTVAETPDFISSVVYPRWTKVEKLAFAETLRAELLADHTAEIQRRAEENREKREKELARLPSGAKRERAYIRWRNHLAEEAQKKLRLQEEKVHSLQEKADKLAFNADEKNSRTLNYYAQKAQDRVDAEDYETTFRQRRAMRLKQQADELAKDPTLARKKRIAWSYLSEDSDAE